MAITPKYVDIATKDLGLQIHNFESDSFYVCLMSTDPTASAVDYTTDFSSFEIANGNGYLTGGVALSSTVLNEGANPYDWLMQAVSGYLQVEWTASGGNIGPFRYVGVYNNTAAGKNAVCYYDLGGDKTITNGDGWVFRFTNGLLKLTHP